MIEEFSLNINVESEGELEKPEQGGGHEELITVSGEVLMEKSLVSCGKVEHKKWKILARGKGDQSQDLGK